MPCIESVLPALSLRAHLARFGFSICRVLTDNGSFYKHLLFAKPCPAST